jgi:hypothetical protein
MDAISPVNGAVITDEARYLGGKNSKRGPSIKTIAREVGEMDVPEVIKEKFAEKGIILTDMNIAKAMAYAASMRALEGSTADWKEFNDRHDGKASQHIDITGGLDIRPNEEKIIEFLEKHGLAKRT